MADEKTRTRQILVRGWNGKRWLYGDLLHGRGRSADKLFILEADATSPILVENSTVGQFTGIKDDSGTLIFEGDNVEYTRAHGRGTDTGIVQWEPVLAQFVLKNPDALLHKDFGEIRYMKPVRIIGNVYGLSEARAKGEGVS